MKQLFHIFLDSVGIEQAYIVVSICLPGKHTLLTSLNLCHDDSTSLDYANHLQQVMLVPSLALRWFRSGRLAIDLDRRGLLALAA